MFFLFFDVSRGMLGRVYAKKYLKKWRYDLPTPLLFSTPVCAIFNYQFSREMYDLQQHIIFITGEIQRVYRGYKGRIKAKQRNTAVHWARSAVIKLRFLVGRKHRRLRQYQYKQQHYSLSILQGEFRRLKASNQTYDHRTTSYQTKYRDNEKAAIVSKISKKLV